MRRALLCTLLLALVGTGVALADHQEPQKRITQADQARARAMLLKRSDLGAGYTVQQARVPEPHVDCEQSASAADLTLTGDAEGTHFLRRTVEIGSAAQVYESLAEASAAWRRGASAAALRCLRSYLDLAYASQGLRIVSVAKVGFPRVADRTAAIRAVISGTTAQGDVRAWIDVVMLARSRAHVQLVVGSVFTPPARADELRLARVLAGRMARAMRS